ncbi:MAG: hypothetical protein HGA36_04330 [Candidatus Moranbacteria bacterium]|nr:hypothetical protein [Candidatus Moranbacteria bacterium]
MQNNTNKKHEILLGLTTTPNSDWRGKVAEMKKFGIKKIALFPTFLNVQQRKELYALLEEIEDLEIPHVHLRSQDMEAWEMELFEKKYKTSLYNIHMGHELNACLEEHRGKIFIENHFKPFDEKYLSQFGGICFDVQHHARSKFQAPGTYKLVNELLNSHTVGCCHVSAFPQMRYVLKRLWKRVGGHYMLGLSELDYIGQYRQYLPYYISLELENSFEEQLKAKQHVEKILNT